SRLLGAPGLGARDDQDVQARRPHLLSPAQMGRRLGRAEMGRCGRDRRGGEEPLGRTRNRAASRLLVVPTAISILCTRRCVAVSGALTAWCDAKTCMLPRWPSDRGRM